MANSYQQEEEQDAGREQPQETEQQSSDPVDEAVYTQYIIDRVTGHSYVSRRSRRSQTQTDSSNSNTSTNDNDLPDEVDYDEENTDCLNRPPHWLCYVPPFVAKFPYWLEQNPVCVWAGNVQFRRCEYNYIQRRRIFLTGFVFNFISLYLVMISCFAFSDNYPILHRISFTRSRHSIIVATEANLTEALIIDDFRMDMGLRALAFSGPANSTFGDSAIRFGEFCDWNTSEWGPKAQEIYEKNQENICGKCKQSSNRFLFSLLMNMLAIVKNMFSDINRMYPKYDLNCPNFMGSLMGIISVGLGFNTLYLYQSRCFREVQSNPSFIMPFIIVGPGFDGLPLDDLVVVSQWERGPGMIFLSIATWLRLADTLCNFLVPSPSIARSRKEQKEYELQYGKSTKPLEEDEDGHDQLLLKHEEEGPGIEMVHDTDTEGIIIVKRGRVIVETNHTGVNDESTIHQSEAGQSQKQQASPDILTSLSFGAS